MSAIRPKSFNEFHGQKAAVDLLKVAVLSAKRRKKPLGHALLTGPAGVGKTTLAMSVLPNELGAEARSLVCSAISEPKQFLPVLSTMKEGSLLFLDELHCLPRICQEQLFSTLEDGTLTISFDDDKTPPMSVKLPDFTIIGATTREGLLAQPLRDRFKHQIKLELYSDDEMVEVLGWTVLAMDATFDQNAVDLLVKPCHGTARFASRLIEACIDTCFAQEEEPDEQIIVINKDIIKATLKRLGYSPVHSFSKPEFQLLIRLASASGATGLNTLASLVDEEVVTVSEIIEPWLLRKGFIEKTPSGRKITQAGRNALAEEINVQDTRTN